MGKKYIIEVEDKPFELLSGDGFTSEKLFRVKGFNSLVFDWNGLNMLTPYTEPDLGQVRKKAYKIGYEKGYRDGVNRIGDAEDKIRKEAYDEGYDDAKGGYENGFENGMIVAWDAARKIIHMPEVDLLNLFTECYSAVCTPLQVFLKYDASECIEKIRQYEQEKEFKVGDEFENESGKKFVVLKMNGKEIDRYIDVDGKTYCMNVKYKVMRKTGRHFPEIATILEKMRGEQDG